MTAAAPAARRRKVTNANTQSGGKNSSAIIAGWIGTAACARSDARKTASAIARAGANSVAASKARDHIDDALRAARGTIHNAYHGYAFGSANHAASANAEARSAGGSRRTAKATAPSAISAAATAGTRPTAAASRPSGDCHGVPAPEPN